MPLRRKLFDFTQSNPVQVLGAWVIIPAILSMASDGAWDLIWATDAVVHGMSFWESFPYVTVSALMAILTGCGKVMAARLRRQYKPF